MRYLAVGAAGAAGAVSRYLVGLFGLWVLPSSFPWTTMTVNLSGSFLLGLVVGVIIRRGRVVPSWQHPVTAGFLGSYTTFSAWAVDSVTLYSSGLIGYAALNVALSLTLGLAAAYLGLWFGKGGSHR